MMIIGAFAVSSMISLYKAVTAQCPWQRRYSFILPFLFRLAVVSARFAGVGGGDPNSFNYLVSQVSHLSEKKRICACLFLSFIFQDIAAIAGAFIGASNIPERWFPGSLDLVCNSHHIMHVLVVVAAYQMHQAVLQDLAWMTAVSEGKLAC